MQDRRGRIRVAALVGPFDVFGIFGQITFPPELDRKQVRAAVARHENHHVAELNRRRDRVGAHSRRMPDRLTGFEVVAARGHATHNDLLAAGVFHDKRRRPGAQFVAVLAPDLFAGVLV